jgi:intracellular septation protein A
MNQPEARAIRPAHFASLRAAISVLSAGLLAVVLAIVLFTMLRSPLKDDIAWLLYVARRWLAGRELYIDVVEVNPPLIVWISAIPIQLARWLHIDAQYTAIPFFVGAVLGCAWWTASLLRGSSKLFEDRLPVFAAIGTVLLVVPAGDLGQREHLLVAAILPYLALFARSLDRQRSRLRDALIAGALAGLGCALKPRYAGVFLVLEGLAFLRGSNPFNARPLAAAATMLSYAVLVALFCPAYLRRAVPLAIALYGATDVPLRHLVADSLRLMIGQAVALILWWHRRRRMPEANLMLTLVVVAITATAICFMDGKDWFYHRLPATIATVLALLCWVASALLYRQAAGRRSWVSVVAGAVTFVAFSVAAFQRLEPQVALAVEPEQNTIARLERLIRSQHARTYIAFSEWIALGFPVVNNTGVTWASRFDSMWALKGELWRVRFDPAGAKAWPIRHWVAHDFIVGCPDIAVVDTREGVVNYVGVLSASDPAFARAWSRYRQIAAFDGLTVYRRAATGCIDPWVAAQSSR